MTVAFRWLVALLACAPLTAQVPNHITSVRAWPLDGVTRIAIETTAQPVWRAEAIENPDRLFFDILDAGIRLDRGAARTVEIDGPLVQRARIAMNKRTVARVVLDLKRKVDYNVSVLSNPWRIMVELRPQGGSPPAPAPAPVETAKAEAPAPVEPLAAPPKPEPKPEPAPSVTLAKPPKPAGVNTVTGKRSLTRALGLKLNRIVLDPGHGGHDLGTTGPTGLHEKDLVLDVTLRLGALIEARMGAEVVYTRTEDVFVPLEERTALANRSRADLFLSIHANSSRLRAVAGPETFYLNLTSSRDDLEVAARENAANGQNIFELQTLLQKIATQDKVQESSEFAARMQRALHTEAAKSTRALRNRGVKKAPFVVLIGAKMPSILTEIGFLSNAREESLLKRDAYRQRIAEALYQGVDQYAGTLSKMEVAREGAAAPGRD
ncbi:MAG: N-acetylmuramoyl-L-alanine amidase [Bryobacteraceae bacterium]|nr:N-acetylmuramoyl-L-alanine amidase [Bryobacteraceae bacterium]